MKKIIIKPTKNQLLINLANHDESNIYKYFFFFLNDYTWIVNTIYQFVLNYNFGFKLYSD